MFGHLPTVIECGRLLRTHRSANMRRFALLLLGCGGLLANEQPVIEDAIETATRDAARGIPHAREIADDLVEMLAMMNGTIAASSRPPPADLHTYVGLFAGRAAVNRGDHEAARAIADHLAGCGPVLEASQWVTLGLLDEDEDHCHRALRHATEHGFRLIAVDALEGLGVAAASADNSTEALRLFGAADRLRDETGYRWRFPVEHDRFDIATAAAHDDLGDAAEDAWEQGRQLDLDAAAEYADRARGERARPRHGWDSLTPTELQVVELTAAGRSNPEIAERLLMSRSTVKTHLEHVYTKTGVRNRIELAAEVVRRDRGDR